MDLRPLPLEQLLAPEPSGTYGTHTTRIFDCVGFLTVYRPITLTTQLLELVPLHALYHTVKMIRVSPTTDAIHCDVCSRRVHCLQIS